MFKGRAIAAIATIPVLAMLITIGSTNAALATSPSFGQLSGNLPFTSANVEVEALTSSGAIPIMNVANVSNPYSLSIPDTPAIQGYASANNGILNTVVLAENGSSFTSEAAPLSVGGSMTVPMSKVSVLPASAQVASSDAGVSASPDVCVNLTPTYMNNESTRIGQMQTDSQSGISAVYTYKVVADSTFTVGVSIDGGAFSIDGTSSIDNSMTGSTNPEGTGFNHYITDHMNYEEQPNSCGETLVWAYSSNGDTPTGSGVPPTLPWPSCQTAPYYAVLNPAGGGKSGTFFKMTGTGDNYSIVATVFGFSFGGTTGYTTHAQIEYFNASSVGSWVCGGGTGGIDNSPVIYNNPT
jgi:hypothetical protein